jgi:hypothetical protein
MKVFLVLALLCLTSFPSYAQPAMMFNNVDQYIERSSGIWIVDVVKKTDQGPLVEAGPTFEVKVVQTLKGGAQEQTISVMPIFQRLVPGNRYLIFGFNEMQTAQGKVWMDNGNVSPIQITFSLSQLQGKSLKEQIEFILSARSAEIDNQMQQLIEEEKAIDQGLEFQRQRDKVTNHGP